MATIYIYRGDIYAECWNDHCPFSSNIVPLPACLNPNLFVQFQGLIVAGFGFDRFHTILLQMPQAAFQLLYVGTTAVLSTKIKKSRCVLLCLLLVISLIGCTIVRNLPSSNKAGKLIGIWLFGAFGAGFPLSLSLIASNTAGFTKKATVTAIVFIGYCAGNIAGPQLFFTTEAPSYPVCLLLLSMEYT